MSRYKTFLSKRRISDPEFGALSDAERQDIEKSLDFIPAHRLDAVREQLGQDRFVHISGKSWKQVSRYLRGDAVPTAVLQAIADDTGATIDWLAQGRLHSLTDSRLEGAMLGRHSGSALMRLNQPIGDHERLKAMYRLKLIYDRLDALDSFMPHDPPPAPERSQLHEALAVDRLAAAIEAVEEGLSGRQVPARVKAELTIAAYDLLTEATAENRARVMRLVKGG